MTFILTYLAIGLGFSLGVYGVTKGSIVFAVIGLGILLWGLRNVTKEWATESEIKIAEKLNELKETEEIDTDFSEDFYSSPPLEKNTSKDDSVIEY